MFVGHSPCVHMISSQLTLYYLHVSDYCDAFSVLYTYSGGSGFWARYADRMWKRKSFMFFIGLSPEMLE